MEQIDALPPIGSFRKVSGCTHEYTQRFNGQTVKIIAHHRDRDGDLLAVFEADDYEYHAISAERFEPVLTAEQISAKQRNDAQNSIKRLILDGFDIDPILASGIAGHIADADFRRFEIISE